MPEIEPGSGSSIGSQELWVGYTEIPGLLLGDPVCEADPDCVSDAPGDPCDLGGAELVLEYRDLLSGWLDDDGAWELMSCCGGEGISLSCCPDVLLPNTVTLTILAAACGCLGGTYTLTFDGEERWTLSTTLCGYESSIELRCLLGTWQFAIVCDGVTNSNSLTLDTCDPLRLTGTLSGFPTFPCCTDIGATIAITIDGDSVSSCEVWGYFQTLHYHATEDAEERCGPAPDDCCEDEPTTSEHCCDGHPWPSRIFMLLDAPDCPVLDGLIIPLDWSESAGLTGCWIFQGGNVGDSAYFEFFRQTIDDVEHIYYLQPFACCGETGDCQNGEFIFTAGLNIYRVLGDSPFETGEFCVGMDLEDYTVCQPCGEPLDITGSFVINSEGGPTTGCPELEDCLGTITATFVE